MAGFEKQGNAGVGIFTGWFAHGKSSDPNSVNHRWDGVDVLKDRAAHMLSPAETDLIAQAAQAKGIPLTEKEVAEVVAKIKAAR
jgi:hypothetical protein